LRYTLRRNVIAPYFEVALGGRGMGFHHISLNRSHCTIFSRALNARG
jgi:hypothetical protein